MELKELEDWNCCGATAYFHVDELLAFTLCARNIAMAEKQKLPLVAPCSGCYKNMYFTRDHLKHDPDLAEHINDALAEDNLKFSGDSAVHHLIEVFVNDVGLPEVKAKVTNPLKGLRVARLLRLPDHAAPQSARKMSNNRGSSRTWSPPAARSRCITRCGSPAAAGR